MSILVFNSYSSPTEQLEYPVEQNPTAYSTIPYSGDAEHSADEDFRMDVCPPEPDESEGFLGSDIREAVTIVRDWASNK
jgi:hypothetical protein